MPLTLTLSNGQKYPHQGHIDFVDRQMNQQTGAIRLAAAFPNPGGLLRPGQFGRITAATDVRHGALLVPQIAVQELQGIQQVNVAGPDNKVHVVNVTLGPQFGNDWIIESGLEPGALVITDNLQKLMRRRIRGLSISKHLPVQPLRPKLKEVTMSKFFIRRPIVADRDRHPDLTVIIGGVVSMLTLPTSQYPDIVPPEIQVQAIYAGADAKTLEQSVATPIEQQMNGVDNMLYMYSVNANNGQTALYVDFDVKTNPDDRPGKLSQLARGAGTGAAPGPR